MRIINLSDTVVEVDIQNLKRSFFRPYLYTGEATVWERDGAYTEVQTAQFEYDCIDKTVEFSDYSQRGAPRVGIRGPLPGVIDCYPEIVQRNIEERIEEMSKPKRKGLER